MRQEQVLLVNLLRDTTGAPLDELLLLVNEGLGITVSRATLNRYLKPASAKNQKRTLAGKKGAKGRYCAPAAGIAPSAAITAYG